MANKKKRKKEGFTLVESLVTLAIFSLILGAVLMGAFYILRDYSYGSEQSQAVEEARRGLETMIKELREAMPGDNGAYPIEKASDDEIIFYSDIDKDGKAEKVRYFWGSTEEKSLTKECVSFSKGGSCSVSFSDFLNGDLKSAKVKISIEGDVGWSKEYITVSVDNQELSNICESGCSDCPGVWQGDISFDVTNFALDGSLDFFAQANSKVDPICDWVDENHSFKIKFELTWTEENPQSRNNLYKGVIEPTYLPVEYPADQEKVIILSSFIRNPSPMFEYFDKDGNKIQDYPARLSDTRLIKVFLRVNVNPNRAPDDFELERYVQPRNLKNQIE